MIEILKVLVGTYSFLFENLNIRIINSKSFNISEALIDIDCGNFILRFIREKGDIFLEISENSSSSNWYDFFLIQKYILKEVPLDYLDLNERSDFLKEYFGQLEIMFDEFHLIQTKQILDGYQKLNNQ